ncbi:MAG: hemolysin family protein [Ornithinimicrobium sp.]
MNDPFVVIAVTTLLIVLSGFFVVIEFGMLGARRHRLEAEASASPRARAALRGANELTLMLAGAQLGITACTFALGAVTKPAVDQWLEPAFSAIGVPGWIAGGASFGLSLLVVTFLHLVVGEMAPKSWAIGHPETAAKLVGIPARAFITVVRPFLLGVNAVANRLVAASGVTPADRAAVGGQDAETIRHLVEQSAATGALDTTFEAHITQALALEELTVGDLMTEGSRPVAVPVGASVREVREAAARSGHLRILLADHDGHLTGVVHVRDTLNEEADDSVAGLGRPTLMLTPATPVYQALTVMRQHGEQLAVVTTGPGAMGVITVTDILRRVLPPARTSSAGGGAPRPAR